MRIGMPTIGWAKTRYTGSNAGDGLFDHSPTKTTQPSRCATPINPRPRTLWRNVPAWCGGHGFGHRTRWNRRELARDGARQLGRLNVDELQLWDPRGDWRRRLV